MAFWVYMLQCGDDSYYVGHTGDIERRISEHESGELGGYTSTRRPVRVLFTQEFSSREEALEAELQIKGWSRKKKQALIREDWMEIARLARRRRAFGREWPSRSASSSRPFETAAPSCGLLRANGKDQRKDQ